MRASLSALSCWRESERKSERSWEASYEKLRLVSSLRKGPGEPVIPADRHLPPLHSNIIIASKGLHMWNTDGGGSATMRRGKERGTCRLVHGRGGRANKKEKTLHSALLAFFFVCVFQLGTSLA